MSDRLRSSILLTHGTIYGNATAIDTVQLVGLTESINRYDYPGFDWNIDVPYINPIVSRYSGPITSQPLPISTVHFSLAGTIPVSNMWAWEQCFSLLVRIS